MMSTREPTKTDASRLKLLLVDEGTLVTPPLMRALPDGGFRVELVADPELADTRGQRYDAVAINADFPGVNALWLCLALRAQGCPSVIMIIGEASSKTDQLAAWRAGAIDRVGHEVPREALVVRILAHVAGARIKVAGWSVRSPLSFRTAQECILLLRRLRVALHRLASREAAQASNDNAGVDGRPERVEGLMIYTNCKTMTEVVAQLRAGPAEALLELVEAHVAFGALMLNSQVLSAVAAEIAIEITQLADAPEPRRAKSSTANQKRSARSSAGLGLSSRLRK